MIVPPEGVAERSFEIWKARTVGNNQPRAANLENHQSMTRPLIAVVVPQNRLWRWHQRIISVLQKAFEVDVYSGASTPHYPLSLQFWVRFESWLLGEVDLVKLATSSSRSWSGIESAPYSFILNLSEAPIIYGSTPILEPRFEGHTDSLRLLAVLIARKNPYLSFHLARDPEPIVASYLAMGDRAALIRGLQISFERLVQLAERAVHHLIQASRPAIPPRPVRACATISIASIAAFFARFFLDKFFGRPIRRLQNLEHWSVALLWSDRWEIPHGVALGEFVVLSDDRVRYYADPFVIAYGGRQWLFVEELEYKTGRGVISCTKLKIGEKINPPTPVLVRPYHLSYPFVFRYGDEIYMIPETASARSVMLFRARGFPFDWVLSRVLLENIELYDSTLLRHQDRWWIFGAVAHVAGSAQDELAIFYSDCLEGPWQPHRLNPVKSDCRSARPAGRIIVRDDRLLRPAQDCENWYGSALVWLEIEELTPERFSEREVGRWPGRAVRGADGLHTFNSDGGLGAIDIRRAVWK